MKNTDVVFEQDPALDHIKVIIKAPDRDENVEALFEMISGGGDKTLTAADSKGALRIIDLRDIISVSIRGKHAQIVTSDEKFTVRQTLQTLETKFEPHRFVRISRYEIVNLDKVKKYDFTLSGTLRLELAGGMETWASRRNIPMIRKKLSEGEKHQ